MEEYVCHYLTDAAHSARAVYHADGLGTAMAMHNSALPEFRDKVLKWVGPSGINFQMHDSRLSLNDGAQPQSGYTHCACRDCMDTTVSSDASKPELCEACREAGCEPFPRDDWKTRAASVQSFECQREDAYGDDVADAGTGHGAYEWRSGN